MKRPLLLSAWLGTALACTHPSSETSTSSSFPRSPDTKTEAPTMRVTDGEVSDADPTPPEEPISPCRPLEPGIRLPYDLGTPPVVVIGFLRSCTTDRGDSGYLPGSPWTAMGFPCTQGRTRIDRRGNEGNPNLVSFPMQTSCPMAPASSEEVNRIVRERLKLPADSNLIAYYPLSIDYWEFTQYPERDTGFQPQLFTPTGLRQGWQGFVMRGEALRVRLYGRENAWERGQALYEVEADIVPEGRSFFRVQVLRAKALSPDERAEVKQRCEALRPRRNCQQVFE